MNVMDNLVFCLFVCVTVAFSWEVKSGKKCENVLCESYQVCEDEDEGATCYNRTARIDCGIFYCYKPRQCCGTLTCCPEKSKCCGVGVCCEADAVCCGFNTCCPPRSVCCTPNFCCEEGGSCCGLSCCGAGAYCDGGICRHKAGRFRWYYLAIPVVLVLVVLAVLINRRRRMERMRANGTVPGTIIMAAQFEPNQPQTANANYGYNQHPSTLQYSQLPAYPSGMTSQSQDQTGVATKPPEYHEVVNPRS